LQAVFEKNLKITYRSSLESEADRMRS